MTNVIANSVDEKQNPDAWIGPPAPLGRTVEETPAPAPLVEAATPQPDAQPATAVASEAMDAKDAEKTQVAPGPVAAPVEVALAVAAAAAAAPATVTLAASAIKPEAAAKPLAVAEKSTAAPPVALRSQKRDSAKPVAAGHIRALAENHGFKAAGVALALGAGWLLGANTFENEAASKRVIASIEALDSKVEAVAAQAVARADISALRASVENSRSGLDATRNNAAAAVAQLTNKFDRAEREHAARFEKQEKDFAARLDRMAERLDRAERAAASHAPTASISQLPPPAAPAPVTLPARAQGPRAEETRVPQSGAEARLGPDRGRIPANGYVLREVRDGAALVEGRAGLREVIPGDVLPGVGRVRSIERRGKQWVVVTSGGVIDASGY